MQVSTYCILICMCVCIFTCHAIGIIQCAKESGRKIKPGSYYACMLEKSVSQHFVLDPDTVRRTGFSNSVGDKI